MIATLNAFYTKSSGSAFMTAVNSRFFEDEAPKGTDYPYAVYKIVTRPKDRTFSSKYYEPLIQISMFSASSESTEIHNILANQETLYDECDLTISGHTFVSCVLENTTGPMQEEHTTEDGTQKVWAAHADYRLSVKL